MPYSSAMNHARKLKFSSYVHLQSVNKMFSYCYTSVILCSVGEVISFVHDWNYISALEQVRMLKCSSSMYKHNL